MKTKEEILKEAYLDIMYSAKTPKEVLEQVYEYAFANGFKQGNDNAKEVAEFEKKKEALQKGTTICGQDYKCKKDYKEGNCWYIKDVIYHCNRDGYLIDQNGISWSCTPEWFREHIQSNTEWAEEEKSHFVSGQFIRCKLSFDEFKEGEHYWLEYVGDDMYVGRSDSILNQKFHITPRQLFTLFSQELEEVQGPPQEEKQVSLTHEPPFDENPSDIEIIEALIHHLNEQDGFLTAINCVSTKAILSWLKKQKEHKPNLVEKLREISTPADEDWFEIQKQWEKEDDKQNQEINLDHFKSYMLQYLQDAANRKDDSEIEKDTDVWAKKLLKLLNIDIKK